MPISRYWELTSTPNNPASPQTIAANGKRIALAIFFIVVCHIAITIRTRRKIKLPHPPPESLILRLIPDISQHSIKPS
ncbi:MAG: hypothetical protein CVU54_14175 [Deltaproteobacteria bacterium HGW-Deltaproteobacteria-12]|jgi:hypothetical protein|nr:MAG: hypothetical protein CVU54_14175 [Deltaproteobacteria bacterium HGW-Deltaproteobacteria-12]